MLNLKEYALSLAKGFLPLVVGLAIINLINVKDWQYLLNYYLISNYLAFYPYNLIVTTTKNEVVVEADEPLRRSKKQPVVADELGTLRRTREEETRADKTSEILSSWVLAFGKHFALLLLAPGLFLYNLLVATND